MIRSLCWILIACVLLSCAHHPRLDPVIKVPDFYEFQTRESGLDVVVDPYEKPYKMNYLFSSDITEKGILALHLIIWNNGASGYNLGPAKILVRSVDGKEYEPLAPDQVSRRVLPSTLARMLGFGAMGTAFIFFTVPFAIGAAVDSEVAKWSIKKDYAEKELKREEIAPKSLFHGFLFFDLGSDQNVFNQPYYFYLKGLKNEATGEPVNVQVRFELKRGQV